MGQVRVSRDELLRFVAAVFSASGVSKPDAATMADVLVWADERGVNSHGVVRVPVYLREIKHGKFKPAAQPVLYDNCCRQLS